MEVILTSLVHRNILSLRTTDSIFLLLQNLDKLMIDAANWKKSLNTTTDKVEALHQLELPGDDAGAKSLLSDIDEQYSDALRCASAHSQGMMPKVSARFYISAVVAYREPKIESLIDRCTSTLRDLNDHKGHHGYMTGESLKDLETLVNSLHKELSEQKEKLQLMWRRAQARVIQSSQLNGHREKANKVIPAAYLSSLLLSTPLLHPSSLNSFFPPPTSASLSLHSFSQTLLPSTPNYLHPFSLPLHLVLSSTLVLLCLKLVPRLFLLPTIHSSLPASLPPCLSASLSTSLSASLPLHWSQLLFLCFSILRDLIRALLHWQLVFPTVV